MEINILSFGLGVVAVLFIALMIFLVVVAVRSIKKWKNIYEQLEVVNNRIDDTNDIVDNNFDILNESISEHRSELEEQITFIKNIDLDEIKREIHSKTDRMEERLKMYLKDHIEKGENPFEKE